MRSNKIRFVQILLLFWMCLHYHTVGAEEPQFNLVLVTLDGVRWQEVFGGVDLHLIEDNRYSRYPVKLKSTYWRKARDERRRLLFPFFWSTIASEGVLIGDRDQGSYMEVTNPWWFSYPGYNEILTGLADPAIDSNDRNWNENVTFLEVLNNTPGFNARVQAFGSWDVFPYIINTQRSRLPVNAGFTKLTPAETAQTRWLNKVAAIAPRLWTTVRLDFITHGYALEALENQQPRVIYIAYGETDDFAHDRHYDRYIDAAHRTDRMLRDLWNWLQADPFYKNRTVLIITTDHGRGQSPEGWPHHASPGATAKANRQDRPDGVPGSDQIWLAAIGPTIQSKGLVEGHWKQSQVAATALASLGLDPSKLIPQAAQVMSQLLR
ncbi:MAG: alkaline phosphatase family protein [Gammaproteobacteria bacterium]|nr:alkaline phosphatase family protein [Gammaproteobacteria bacterium]